MTELTLETPTRLRIVTDMSHDILKTMLTYRDKKIDFELQKFRHATWYADKFGREAYDEKMAALKASRIKCLLFEDDQGLWTYSGMATALKQQLRCEVKSLVKLPRFHQVLPWAGVPFPPYPYQQAALEKLMEQPHAAVEMGTGLGKTLIIAYLVKELGLKTVIMAPSVSIARQIYENFGKWMGKKYVGLFGDGRKDVDKRIIVGIAASLTKVAPESAPGRALAASECFIADESHLCPASTLAKVCYGLLAPATHRYFFSATQMRNDGLDMLLDSITGPVVYRMTVREGINQGYLAKLGFTMVNLRSDSSFESRDINAMTRKHLYYNPLVNAWAARLANKFASQGKQVLILVDEIEQFTHLLPYLRHDCGFAHGGTNPDVLPAQYQKSDPGALVDRFNEGKLPILIGTSCVSIGTDIKANQATINLRGGKSEIEVAQGPIGRSTRLHPPVGKTSCEIIDFNVFNVPAMKRHADSRQAIYASTGAQVKEWNV